MIQDSIITTSSSFSSSLGYSSEERVRFHVPYEAEIFRNSAEFQSTENFEPFIESDPEIQGGIPCLRNTRITVSGIVESIENGHSLEEISKTLKEHFFVSITPREIERAVIDYRVRLALIASGYR